MADPRSIFSYGLRYTKVSLLAIWTYFLGWLCFGPGKSRLVLLLHPDLWWLVGSGALVMLLLLLRCIFQARQSSLSAARLLAGIPQIGILLLPVLYFPLAATNQLGFDALNKRTVVENFVQQNPAEGDPSPLSAPSGKSEAGSAAKKHTAPVSFEQLVYDPGSFIGRDVAIQGMVLTDAKQLAPGTFYCFRFRINCCAADAIPVGIPVLHPETHKLVPGEWVVVQGVFRRQQVGDKTLLLVVADTVTASEAPAAPYLFL